MGNLVAGGIGLTIGWVIGSSVISTVACILGLILGTIFELLNYYSMGVRCDNGYHIDPNIKKIHDKRIVKLFVRKSDLYPLCLNNVITFSRLMFAPLSTFCVGKAPTIWIQHWWIILELENSEYITTFKHEKGIFFSRFSNWNDANMGCNNGMFESGNINVKTLFVKSFISDSNCDHYNATRVDNNTTDTMKLNAKLTSRDINTHYEKLQLSLNHNNTGCSFKAADTGNDGNDVGGVTVGEVLAIVVNYPSYYELNGDNCQHYVKDLLDCMQ